MRANLRSLAGIRWGRTQLRLGLTGLPEGRKMLEAGSALGARRRRQAHPEESQREAPSEGETPQRHGRAEAALARKDGAMSARGERDVAVRETP